MTITSIEAFYTKIAELMDDAERSGDSDKIASAETALTLLGILGLSADFITWDFNRAMER